MIWPFTKKKEEHKVPGFQGVRFTDLDGTKYDYCPAEDITPYELALLWPLALTNNIVTDRFAYIKKHNLIRFFKPVIDK